MNREEITERIIDSVVVAVIRLKNGRDFYPVAYALLKGGVTSIELTMTTPNAFESLSEAVKKIGSDVCFGMGSVINKKDAQQAIDAGAEYIVSPILKDEVIETAHKNEKPVMPGAFSPTEIQSAYEKGADIIKVFPADILGMEYFKAIKAPLPHLRLMPTGGVSLNNVHDWLKAGACAVGIGSALLDKKAIEEKNFSVLTKNAQILFNNLKTQS